MADETVFRLAPLRQKCARKDCERSSTHLSIALLEDGTVQVIEWCQRHGLQRFSELREERAMERGFH